MRKAASVLALLLILSMVLPAVSIPSVWAAEDSWTILAPPSEFATFIGAAEVDEKIYLISSNVTKQYTLETNTWTAKSPLPIYNGWAAVVACQNKIYVIGGNAEVPTQVYDPATDTWENRTSIPETKGVYANVVDDKIYLIGGIYPAFLQQVFASPTNDVYDPETDSWSRMAPMPTPVMGYASAVVDNKIYIIAGGTTTTLPGEPTNKVQIFDPETNQWTNGTSIPTGVCYAKACATTGLLAPKRIYVVGGALNYNLRGRPTYIDITQVYDPETDSWSVAASTPITFTSFALVNVNDELYAVGLYRDPTGDYFAPSFPASAKYTPLGYIPEFPSWIILPLLLTSTLLIILCRRKLTKTPSQQSY